MPKLLSFLLIALLFSFTGTGFKDEQLKYSRVRTAFAEKQARLLTDLKVKGISESNLKVYLRAFKEERKLEAWVSNGGPYSLLRTYNFCNSSGTLGPKRRQGDGQIPEGLYTLDYYNPSSSYMLSLRVSYPNSSDQQRKTGSSTGGDIFIHGGCATIGCIPITDDKIKELYTLAVLGRDAQSTFVPIHIFPFKMTIENMNSHGSTHKTFWNELLPFYTSFEQNHRFPKSKVLSGGAYVKL